jgi:hypothetical protein
MISLDQRFKGLTMKKLTLPLLILILLISFILGTKMLFHGDFFYLFDQARDYMLVQNIVTTHKLTMIGTHSGLGGFFHGPLWLYMLIPFYLFGGGNPFTFTYAYVLLAVVTVLSGFFIGKKLYDTTVGLLLAFFLAISPTIWAYVPNTIGVNTLPLIFVFLIYFIVRFLRGEAKAYVFVIFFAGLSLQFETAVSLALLPIVILTFFLNTKAIRQAKIILLSIVSFFISIITFILFDVRHQFLMAHALLGLFTSGKHEKGYLPFADRIPNHAASFQNVYESVLIQKNNITEVLLLLLFVGLLFYLYKKKIVLNKMTKEFWYLVLFPIALFIVYLGYSYPIYPEYLLGLTVPVGLAVSLVCIKIWRMTVGKVLVILFLAVNLFYTSNLLFATYQPAVTAGNYLVQQQVAQWIFHDSNGKKVGYFVYTPETFTYGMDYLLWWESKQLGVVQPVSQKLPITYLILYPHLSNDAGAYTFWEKTKLRTSAPIIEKKEFSGGITVEKLSIKPGEPAVDPTYYQNLIFR